MCAVFSAGESGRTGEVSRIVEAGRGTEEKTPRPVLLEEGWLVEGVGWSLSRSVLLEWWVWSLS